MQRTRDDQAFDAFLETVDSVDLDAVPDEGETLGAPPPGSPSVLSVRSSSGDGRTSPSPPEAVPLIRLTGGAAEDEAGEGDGGIEPGDYTIRGLIGEGGMGKVHLAWQRSVGREVAVKVPRDGPGRASRIVSLLREARITGRLEHPNIVPMHGLGRTPDGSTVMVMKRVEGESWRDIADDPSKLPERFRCGDTLESHLRILMEVCDAVHFAHSRGVLHRDLKLDNVLVGAFGEVYVVDWGIAVALEDDGTGHLPLAADVAEPSGTPGYMAPEMAAGQGHRLGPHSDVYCLGALLHRLLTGKTRHVGGSYGQVLVSAWTSAPFDYSGLDLPRELTAICARATAAAPADRFPDVPAFRRAVAQFLEHRSSSRLVEEAARAAADLDAALAAGQADAAERHFGAARFALEHALRVWPDNPDARLVLDRLLLGEAERGLDAGRGSYAEQLLGAVLADDPALAPRKAALAARVEADRARRARLGEMSRELDLGVFTRHRGAITLVLGLLWALNGLRRDATPPSVEQLVRDQVWMIAAVVGLVALLRRWLWSTRINRRVSLALIGIVTMDMAIRLAGWRLGLPAPQIAALEMVVDVGGVMYLALLLDLRLLVAVAAMAVGAAWGIEHLDRIFQVTAFNILVALSIIGVIWLRRPPGDPADR